jgi:hypothetical protein
MVQIFIDKISIMNIISIVDEPLDNAKAKKLVREILTTGTLSFSRHAYVEMAKDGMLEIDVKNTLRAGQCVVSEFENSSWRYRFETSRFAVVVAFRAEDHAIVVTAWKFKR